MNEKVKQFIKENTELINEDTKESWEEIYKKLDADLTLRGEFTTIMLDADIDPAQILDYIPNRYLYRSNIVKYKIPNSVTSISSEAFCWCYSLTSIEIPEGVTSIGSNAFSYCKSLASIVIPNSVTSIGESASFNCTNLTNIYITNLARWCNVTGAGNLMYYGSRSKNLYVNNELVIELVIPNSVTSISERAFSYCNALTSVVIPDSVTSIGSQAFAFCNGLTSVVIPNSVTSIGDYAFDGCTSLTSITYLGAKKQAMKLGIGNKPRTKWRGGSVIEKIICTDGEIEL